MTNTSFYKGNVVKLTWQGGSRWEVVSVYDLDTNADENIHTNFMHKTDLRTAIIPATAIENFDPVLTKKVSSWFDVATQTEHWEATQ